MAEVLQACLGQVGAPLISNPLPSGDARTFATYPTYIEPSSCGSTAWLLLCPMP